MLCLRGCRCMVWKRKLYQLLFGCQSFLNGRQASARAARIGVVQPQHLLTNRQRALIIRARRRRVALRTQQIAQLVTQQRGGARTRWRGAGAPALAPIVAGSPRYSAQMRSRQSRLPARPARRYHPARRRRSAAQQPVLLEERRVFAIIEDQQARQIARPLGPHQPHLIIQLRLPMPARRMPSAPPHWAISPGIFSGSAQFTQNTPPRKCDA